MLAYRVFIKYCVFSKILKYIPDSGLSQFPPRCECVYTMASQTPTLQQNWQSSEKSQYHRKNTISNEHPVFVIVTRPSDNVRWLRKIINTSWNTCVSTCFQIFYFFKQAKMLTILILFFPRACISSSDCAWSSGSESQVK